MLINRKSLKCSAKHLNVVPAFFFIQYFIAKTNAFLNSFISIKFISLKLKKILNKWRLEKAISVSTLNIDFILRVLMATAVYRDPRE